jgi:23S rRNA-/tRNA-specific pseudouridylate synthase
MCACHARLLGAVQGASSRWALRLLTCMWCPPAAQSWLRRFGANGTALDKAFRTKQVRCCCCCCRLTCISRHWECTQAAMWLQRAVACCDMLRPLTCPYSATPTKQLAPHRRSNIAQFSFIITKHHCIIHSSSSISMQQFLSQSHPHARLTPLPPCPAQVRIFDGARFKRIKNRTRALQAGDVLLVPNEVSSLMRLLPHPPPAAAAALAAARRAQAEQKDRHHGDDDTVWAEEAAGAAPQRGRDEQPATAAAAAAAAAADAGQRVRGAAGRKLQAAAAVHDEEADWLPGPGPVSPRAAKTARGAAAARAVPVHTAPGPEWAGGRAITAPADNRDAALRQQREQDAAQQQRERAAEPLERAVKRWVIARESDYLVLNKPPGVHVTGGSADSSSGAKGSSTSTAGASSIEQVLESSLSLGEQDQPTLVHDLAPAASGCLLVARSPQAAGWLQAAFERGHAYIDPTSGGLVADPEGDKASEDGTAAKGRQKRKVAAAKEARGRRSLLPLRVSVGRTYLAVVQGNMQGHRRGVINKQVMEGGQLRGAKTVFKVKHSGDGLTLLELTPLTGEAVGSAAGNCRCR